MLSLQVCGFNSTDMESISKLKICGLESRREAGQDEGCYNDRLEPLRVPSSDGSIRRSSTDLD